MKLIRTLGSIVFLIALLTPITAAASWKNSGDLKVAVLDLASRVTNETIDVITLTEMLQAEFANQKAFKVVERSMLNKVLEEHKLSMSGLTEREASKVGALAGAQKIITGSVSKMGDRYVLIIKGIDTKTGVVEVSDQAMAYHVDGLMNAIPSTALRLVQRARGEAVTAAPVDMPTTAPPSAARHDTLFLEERFVDNRHGWPIGDWEAASTSIRDQQYLISMKKQIQAFYSKIDLAMEQSSDFSVESTITKLSGDEGDTSFGYYGIIVGRDFKNMYEFCVHPGGRLMIRRQVNGETSFILSSVLSAWVKRGNSSNTFTITKKGSTLSFYLNGHLAGTEQGGLLLSDVNLVGFTTWKNQGADLKIAVKDFTVRLASQKPGHAVTVTGSYNSTEGAMTLQQQGERVTGRYGGDNGEIVGTLNNTTLQGYWIEDNSNHRCSTAKNGRYYWGNIELTFDGDRFGGRWGYCNDPPTQSWSGQRK